MENVIATAARRSPERYTTRHIGSGPISLSAPPRRQMASTKLQQHQPAQNNCPCLSITQLRINADHTILLYI